MNPFKRIQYNAPVTLTFTFISFAALLILQATDWRSLVLFSVYRAPATDPLTYVRLFGHALGHADITHFFSNFVIILLVGPMLEEKYGGRQLAALFAVTAFVTGLLFMLLSKPNTLLLGASGIVFMMILLGSFTNLQKGRVPLTFILAVAVFIGREVFADASAAENVSRATHIAGGVCGAVFGFVINRKKILD